MNNKSERITVRLTKDQKDNIKLLAIKQGITVSEMFLVAMSRYIAEEEKKQIENE